MSTKGKDTQSSQPKPGDSALGPPEPAPLNMEKNVGECGACSQRIVQVMHKKTGAKFLLEPKVVTVYGVVGWDEVRNVDVVEPIAEGYVSHNHTCQLRNPKIANMLVAKEEGKDGTTE